MITKSNIRPYLLFDGAMGTYYALKNRSELQKCELANLYAPEVIEGIHNEYIEAGARAIKTNTFSANTVSLSAGQAMVEEAVRAGFEIASRAAAPGGVKVFADIGPIPDAEDVTLDSYFKILDVFLDCGAENFLFETFSEYETVLKCAAYIKNARKESFILAQYAVSPDGYTRKGIPTKKIFHAMEQSDSIDAYGLNCISGPKHIYENLLKAGKTAKPLSAMPNAGYPSIVGERTFYNFNASYFASVMADIYNAGVTILGGCCGTTPEHIAGTKKILDHPGAVQKAAPEAESPAFIVRKRKNNFKEKLADGKKVIAVELDPPLNADASKIISGADAVKEAGADIVTIADNPLARARGDSALIALKVMRECGIETLPHITCRDRNLNAIKGALLGMHIEGVRNVLAVTGDPVPQTDRSDIKGVYNMNSKMLAAYIEELNQSVFAGDGFYTGAALNVNANRTENEIKRAQEKMENGVRFFLTQPVFSKTAAEAFLRAKAVLKEAKILAGVMPLVSYKNACFINNEVSGITIGEDTIAAFEGKTKEESARLGIEIAFDMAKVLSEEADGFYLITPLYRVDVICELIRKIRRYHH